MGPGWCVRTVALYEDVDDMAGARLDVDDVSRVELRCDRSQSRDGDVVRWIGLNEF